MTAFLGRALSAGGVHTDSTAVGAHSQIPLRSLPLCDGLVRPHFLFLFYLFPVPLLAKPQCGAKSTSHRMRVRRSGKLDLWRSANNVISTLNCLDEGHCRHRTLARHEPDATFWLRSPLKLPRVCAIGECIHLYSGSL